MVTFIEMRGDGAASALRDLQRERTAQDERSELLVGRDQPDVVLLVCWGPGPERLPAGDVRGEEGDRSSQPGGEGGNRVDNAAAAKAALPAPTVRGKRCQDGSSWSS